jgi:alpha-galactosidase
MVTQQPKVTPLQAKIEVLIQGDMVGDKPLIGESHIKRANALFPVLQKMAAGKDKFVVAIGGESGSGKSETSALIGTRFIQSGSPAYVLSCDNYPHRPPRMNDAHRVEIFEEQKENGLREYLGTENEIDFPRLGQLVAAFKRGEPTLSLRIMNAAEHYVQENDRVLDVSNIKVLVLEGTWSHFVPGADARVYLETNFRETLEHRKARARDPITPFTEMVLQIEHAKLEPVFQRAGVIVASMDGTVAQRA